MKKMLIAGVAAFLLAFAGFAAAAVDLNSATVAELEAVKGIGPAKAKAIVDHREKNGPFKSVDDLKNVKGFGAKSVEKLRAELTTGASAPPPAPAPAAAASAPKAVAPAAAPAPMPAPAPAAPTKK
jgi:competence protein ComEA